MPASNAVEVATVGRGHRHQAGVDIDGGWCYISGEMPRRLPLRIGRAAIPNRWVPWPWLDALGLSFVTQVYLPASRGWAAACAADEDVDRFRVEAGVDAAGAILTPALTHVRHLKLRYRTTTGRWEDAFFADPAPSERRLATVERARNSAATQFMLARTAFTPWIRQMPPVRWDMAPPAAMEGRWGELRSHPEAAYRPQSLPQVRASHAFRRGRQRRYWLRFPSAVLGDTVWARVMEPLDVPDPPTLVFLHGIAMEQDLWPPARTALAALVNQGVRVVRPEGPWHGRRMLKGYYGGEPILARGPHGLLTFLRAWVAEAACLIGWARETGSPRIAIGGASLGALTSQLVTTVSASWPRELQPDAALLVATTGRPMDIVTSGSLARAIGLPAVLDRAGWTADGLEKWLCLFEPRLPPVMDPDRIVIVLGAADDLMPREGGLQLAAGWNVPKENLFVQPQGHFSVSLALLNDPAPMRRFLALLGGALVPKAMLTASQRRPDPGAPGRLTPPGGS